MTATPRALIVVVLVVTAVAVFRPSFLEAQGSPTNQRLAALESQVATLQGQVAALLASNATLLGNINAEATARGAADMMLQTQIDNVATVPQNLLDLANYVSIDTSEEIQFLSGPHIIFSGANVHIQNGTGATGITNGLGNLIVGYNETGQLRVLRSGSHNIVVGVLHDYTSWGEVVANIISQVP